MGRTVPSFRIAEMQEVGEWRAFRRSLPKRERKAFDDMLDTARLYISASSFAVRTSRLEGMGMALLFHHYKQLHELSDRLEREEQ
jgi:hypothetical protein